jgi:hypothetical protein
VISTSFSGAPASTNRGLADVHFADIEAYGVERLAYRGVENKLAEVLNAGDLEYEQNIRGIIIGYGNDLQKALRRLLKTRNANNLTSQEWERFFKDCLIDSPSNNRGPVKAELRGIVGRVLDELGA